MEDDGNVEISESEKITRFGCGALLGLLLATVLIFEFALSSFGLMVAVISSAVFVCGILALKYGDEFWLFIKDWWYFFWY
jgi:hypothetical protein